jgi:NADPH:quinone reductase-like Zn-dependent oxidoreductase
MQAAAFTELGSVDGVEQISVDDPEPGPGEAVVDVEAASLNYHDLLMLTGESASGGVDLPFVSGLDLAGTVASVGEGVDVAPGDRVLRCPNETCGTCRHCREGPENRCDSFDLAHGGFAERTLVDADRLVEPPEAVGAETAAALPTAYVTAWHMLRRADVTAGDRVFVPGATGNVGIAAIQLLGALGAQSIGSSGNPEKADKLAAIGADETVASRDPEELRAAIDPVDAVLNHLGGEYVQLGMDLLERGGAMALCGRTAGATAEISVTDLYWDQYRLVGSTMGTQTDLERVVSLVAEGAIDPVVDATYGLDEAETAFRRLRDSDAFGALVLVP